MHSTPIPVSACLYTAGSNAVTSYFTPLRKFGRQVRQVLLENAARKWDVAVSELTTEPSVVVHQPSGRRLSYGEIAQFAVVPENAPEIGEHDLKPAKDFRYIGTDVLRVDLPGKVNGTADYAINVQLPGMIYGAVLRSPIEGGRPVQVNDANARGVAGVLDIISLPYGVGVLAQTAWAAFAAHEQLRGAVKWSGGKAVGIRQRPRRRGICRRRARPQSAGKRVGQAWRCRGRTQGRRYGDRSRLHQRLRLSRANGAAERGCVGVFRRR